MPCEFFGPIRLSDSATITAWQNSCVAAGQHPKWTGPWKSGGHSDVMLAYCCTQATDVPPDAVLATTPGATIPGDMDRQDLLRLDLEAVSERYSILTTVLDTARSVLDSHHFDIIEFQIEKLQATEGSNPRDDLGDELRKLKEKLERLGNDPKSYTPKLPWHWQIDIRLLVDILVEIMQILAKLAMRSVSAEEISKPSRPHR